MIGDNIHWDMTMWNGRQLEIKMENNNGKWQ